MRKKVASTILFSWLLFWSFWLLVPMALAATSDPDVTTIQGDLQIKKPIIKVNIPKLNFSDAAQNVDEKGYLHLPWIGEYLTAIYQFAMAIASILAVIVIIIQGVRVIISAGGEEKNAAYKRIFQAFIGLLICWGSYAILYNINPDLVQFKALKIKYIEPDNLASPDYDGSVDLAQKVEVATGAGCANYEGTAQGREKCRQACNAGLPDNRHSKASGSAQDNSRLGFVDCSAVKSVRDLKNIEFIGLHEGSMNSGLTWWWYLYATEGKNKAYGSHYFISRDGVVHQIVDERFEVWHGVRNSKSIGIDLDGGCNSGNGSDAESQKCNYTPAQYAALKKLVTEISQRTNVKLDDDHVKAHCEMSKAVSVAQ